MICLYNNHLDIEKKGGSRARGEGRSRYGSQRTVITIGKRWGNNCTQTKGNQRGEKESLQSCRDLEKETVRMGRLKILLGRNPKPSGYSSQ